jgi:hypothetical protein
MWQPPHDEARIGATCRENDTPVALPTTGFAAAGIGTGTGEAVGERLEADWWPSRCRHDLEPGDRLGEQLDCLVSLSAVESFGSGVDPLADRLRRGHGRLRAVDRAEQPESHGQRHKQPPDESPAVRQP